MWRASSIKGLVFTTWRSRGNAARIDPKLALYHQIFCISLRVFCLNCRSLFS